MRLSLFFLFVFMKITLMAEVVLYKNVYYSIDSNNLTASVVKHPDGKIGFYTGDITIPDYIEVESKKYVVNCLADSAFIGSINLVKLSLPETIERIGFETFNSCNLLKEINIPKNVEHIGEWCFVYCSNIQSIDIPDKITVIEEGVFADCTSLKTIILGANVKKIKQQAFYGCGKLESIKLSTGFEELESYTFTDCKALTSISFPSTTLKIGAAFDGCSKLKDVYCYADNPPSVYSFDHDFSNATLHVPENRVYLYSIANQWKDFGEIVGISGNSGNDFDPTAKYFGVDTGFLFCDLDNSTMEATIVHCPEPYIYVGAGITEYVTYNGNKYKVTAIGEEAYRKCKLDRVEVLHSIKEIKSRAFADCIYLRKMYLYHMEEFIVPDDIFDGTDLSNSTLYVYSNYLDYYRSASPWNKFGYIKTIEGQYDGINEIKKSSLDNKDVFINLNGQIVKNPTKGLYINNGKKIIVR